MITDPDDDALVWGADVGGTSTRVGVADQSGRVLAVVLEGPGNPNTVGMETSAARVRAAAEQALTAADPTGRRAVLTGLIGLAGVSAVDPQAYARLATPQLADSPAHVLVDLAVAYASGTPAPHGVVALAGTGAGAMELVDGRVVGRHNAWGWLVGDEGSAQWIGRAAVRHTLTELERHGEAGAGELARAVAARCGLSSTGTGADRPAETSVNLVLQRVYAQPPHHLAQLAPVVSASPDPAATAILTRAADLVAGHARAVLADRTDLPIVLAGSLAAAGGPLHDRLRDTLSPAAVSVSSAADGVAGACWLALTRAGFRPDDVHARLRGSVESAPRRDRRPTMPDPI